MITSSCINRALVFTDLRQLGHVRFHHGSQEPDWWKRDAPEIDSRGFDQEYLNNLLDRHRKAPIKAVLFMQSGFPGIGNWMADEILWRAKVLPSKRTGKLSRGHRAAILPATKFVVRRSLETLGKDFSESAQELADPSKMETRRSLPASSHRFASRNNRRPARPRGARSVTAKT